MSIYSNESNEDGMGVDAEKKDRRRMLGWLFLPLFLAAGSAIFFLYVREKQDEKLVIQSLREKIVESDISITAIKERYSAALLSGDAALTKIDSLQNALSTTRRELNFLYQEISKLNGVNGQQVSAAENIGLLKVKITELNNESDRLQKTIGALQFDLAAAAGNVRVEKDTLYLVKKEEPGLLERTDKDILPISDWPDADTGNIKIGAVTLVVHDPKNGRPDSVRRAVARPFRVELAIAITDSSALKRQLYLFAVLIGPKSNENKKKEINKIYTARMPVPYNNGQPVQVKHEWMLQPNVKMGIYKLELFYMGRKIAQTSVSINKKMKTQRYI